MSNVSAEVVAKPFANGKIEITVDEVQNDITGKETARERFSREILDTKEDSTHKALMSLGWTPPEGEKPIVADVAMLVDAIIGKGFSSNKHHQIMKVYGHANDDGWIRDHLMTKKPAMLLALYTEGSLNG